MKKKLFLSSSFEDVVSLLPDFEPNLKGKRISFIPTASLVEDYTAYVDSGKDALTKLGLIVDKLEISTASLKDIEDSLRNNDFIYVTGGNTFFLLQELKRTGADKIVVEEVIKGKLYIGESAGSIITTPNIEYVALMDEINQAPSLKNYNSLNLINFYLLPHYGNEPFLDSAEAINKKYENILNLKPISNDQVILVSGNNIQILSK